MKKVHACFVALALLASLRAAAETNTFELRGRVASGALLGTENHCGQTYYRAKLVTSSTPLKFGIFLYPTSISQLDAGPCVRAVGRIDPKCDDSSTPLPIASLVQVLPIMQCSCDVDPSFCTTGGDGITLPTDPEE